MIPFLTTVADYLMRQSWQIAAVFVLVAVVCWGLRKKNAHWRYLLWLVVLVKCLAPAPINVPLAVLSPPVVPVSRPETQSQLERIGPHGNSPTIATVAAAEPANDYDRMVAASSATTQREVTAAHGNGAALPFSITDLTWREWLAATWFAGIALFFSFVSMRAWATHRTLRQTRRPVDYKTASTVALLTQKLGMRTIPQVYMIDGTAQPFVWGWFRGSVYLPQSFTGNGSHQQRQAILVHELAHIVRWDAAVNLLQILVQGVFFFHPFVWMANRQIRLEREKCCDEIVIASLGTDPKQYGKAIVNLLVAEYQATQAAPSLAIAGRLSNIEQRIKTILSPNRRFSRRPSLMAVATTVLAAAIVLPTALVLTARGDSADFESAGTLGHTAMPVGDKAAKDQGESVVATPAAQKQTPRNQMLKLPVRVVDADNKPVANAKITPWALRSSQGHGLWENNDKRAGVGPKEVVTSKDGIATVLYPHYRDVQEQVRTIAVSLLVDHPKFAYVNRLHIDVPLESKGPYEIKLNPGVPVEIRPLIDGKLTTLDDVFVLWSDGRSWLKGTALEKSADGTLRIPAMPPGKNSVLVVKLDGRRATHLSKIVDFELTATEPKMIDVPLQPSLQIQGVLSDSVPRPVRQGRIKIWTLPPAGAASNRVRWFSWTAIQPDGSFTIDGWPADERMQLIALCDGYIATSGSAPDVVKNPPDPKRDSFIRPQVFDPGKNSHITVTMSPLVRCVATAVDDDDKPVAGVTVVSWPNVGWWNGGSQVYCSKLVRGERLLQERKYYDAIDEVFPAPFQGTTDAQGKATLELPAGKEYLAVQSDVYELSVFLGSRDVRVKLVPGQTTEVTLWLQPSGTEKLGDWDKLAGVVFGCSTREGRRICALPSVQKQMNEFAKRFREAKNQRDPQLLSEAYNAVADAFMGITDLEEAAKWREKAADQAAKAKAGEQHKAKTQ